MKALFQKYLILLFVFLFEKLSQFKMEEEIKVVEKLPFLTNAIIKLIAFFTRLHFMTLRIRMSEKSKAAITHEAPNMVLFWHNRILFMLMLCATIRRKLKLNALVSPSKDGAYLESFMTLFRVVSIRGSSRKKRLESALKVIDSLRKKIDVAITPDGPVGPKYVLKENSLRLAQKANAHIIFMRAYPKRFWKLNSWDSFIVPKPFTTIEIDCVNFESVEILEKEAEEKGLTPTEYITKLLGGDNKDETI